MLAAMSVALQQTWTAENFLAWAAAQEGRYEFDGVRPVGMTGGNADHNRVMINIHAALRSRLRGTPCAVFGPDLGVQAGAAIRYPDALVTCTKFPGTERLAPDVCIVFEALSPSTASRRPSHWPTSWGCRKSASKYRSLSSTRMSHFPLRRRALPSDNPGAEIAGHGPTAE